MVSDKMKCALYIFHRCVGQCYQMDENCIHNKATTGLLLLHFHSYLFVFRLRCTHIDVYLHKRKHNQSNSAFRIWLFFVLLTESWDVFVKDYFNGIGETKSKRGKLFILDNQKMVFLLVLHVCWSPSLCAHFSHLPMAHKMGCIPSKAARTTSLFPNWCLSF